MPGSSRGREKRRALTYDQAQARLTHLVDKLLTEGGVPATAKFSIDPNTYNQSEAFEFALGIAIKASSLMDPAKQDLIDHLRWMEHTCRFLADTLEREEDDGKT